MVLVRSLVAEPPRPRDGLPARRAGRSLARPSAMSRTYLSVVPTQLTRALADPATTAALRRFDAVLLGGAAADPALLTRAAGTPASRVVTTYGMSETCGGCVYDGVPLDGVDVTVDERRTAGDRSARRVFAGYRLDPAATADALVDGRLVTRDRGRVAPTGGVEVLGRVDDVVISGGLNVDLAVVERAVRRRGGRRGGGGRRAAPGLGRARWWPWSPVRRTRARRRRPALDARSARAKARAILPCRTSAPRSRPPAGLRAAPPAGGPPRPCPAPPVARSTVDS